MIREFNVGGSTAFARIPQVSSILGIQGIMPAVTGEAVVGGEHFDVRAPSDGCTDRDAVPVYTRGAGLYAPIGASPRNSLRLEGSAGEVKESGYVGVQHRDSPEKRAPRRSLDSLTVNLYCSS